MTTLTFGFVCFILCHPGVFVVGLVHPLRARSPVPHVSGRSAYGTTGTLPRQNKNICSSLSLAITHDTSIPLIPERRCPEGVKVLSEDPLVYVIQNLLTAKECQDFLELATDLEGSRPMKRSNPPEVSLDLQKLWPIPFLALAAGIPPVIRCFEGSAESPSLDQIVSVFISAAGLALAGSVLLAFAVVLPLIRMVSNSSSRTSVSLALNQEEDISRVSVLVDRVAAITSHPWHAWEAPVLTRYSPGAIFARHSDASPTRGSEWKEEGGQRVVTCICYLNTVKNGGFTSFDKLGLDVAPVEGQGLVFFPTVPGTSLDADDRLTHESLPSGEEEKYIIQMFGRVGPRVPPPLGIPAAYNNR